MRRHLKALHPSLLYDADRNVELAASNHQSHLRDYVKVKKVVEES